MKTKTSFNKKIKVKSEAISYDKFVKSLKMDLSRGEGVNILEDVLRILTPKERAKAIVKFLEGTGYAAYSVVLRNFKSAVSRYIDYGDKDGLITYRDNRSNSWETYKEPLFNSLILVKERIISDLLYDRVNNSKHATDEAITALVYETYHDDNSPTPIDFDEEYNKLLRRFLIQAAMYAWPEAKNLNILFGSEK